MAKVLVLYYSSYGHIETMAYALAEGARGAGATVDVKRVPENVPEAVAKAAHFKLDQPTPIASRRSGARISSRILTVRRHGAPGLRRGGGAALAKIRTITKNRGHEPCGHLARSEPALRLPLPSVPQARRIGRRARVRPGEVRRWPEPLQHCSPCPRQTSHDCGR